MMQIWAHRGASKACPENTLDAFERAAALGADGVELDVQLSADGHIIVCHDDTVNRVSEGSGLVGELTLRQIKSLNAAHFFANAVPNYGVARFPTLDEVFALLRPTGLMINVELKHGATQNPGLEQACVDLIRAMRMEERVWFSSFAKESLLRAKAIAPHIPCGFLCDGLVTEPWAYVKALELDALHPHYADLHTPNEVTECHRRGIRVHPWTVDDPAALRSLAAYGVDAVITNVPDVARQALSELSQENAL